MALISHKPPRRVGRVLLDYDGDLDALTCVLTHLGSADLMIPLGDSVTALLGSGSRAYGVVIDGFRMTYGPSAQSRLSPLFEREVTLAISEFHADLTATRPKGRLPGFRSRTDLVSRELRFEAAPLVWPLETDPYREALVAAVNLDPTPETEPKTERVSAKQDNPVLVVTDLLRDRLAAMRTVGERVIGAFRPASTQPAMLSPGAPPVTDEVILGEVARLMVTYERRRRTLAISGLADRLLAGSKVIITIRPGPALTRAGLKPAETVLLGEDGGWIITVPVMKRGRFNAQVATVSSEPVELDRLVESAVTVSFS